MSGIIILLVLGVEKTGRREEVLSTNKSSPVMYSPTLLA